MVRDFSLKPVLHNGGEQYLEDKKEYKRKLIYFSPKEWEIVCKKAAAVYMRTGTYIRKIAVKGSVKKVDLKQLNHLRMSFVSIGTQLNQIAKVANSTQSIYAKDIEEMREQFEYLREVFNDYLVPLKSEDILTGE